MIPALDAARLSARAPDEMERLRVAVQETGFLTLANSAIGPDRVAGVIAAYRAFFALPPEEKRRVDMAATGASRGWGAPLSEQVDPGSNPDYKEVFDSGHEWPESGLRTYAPNLWPARPAGFRATLESYFAEACAVSMDLLAAIAEAIGRDPAHFARAFDRPMALLRGNHYPARPEGAGERDFGIAPHTDYGCLTLLATDGVSGLELRGRDGAWRPVEAAPGAFVVNFGEMLELWTDGAVRATEHRVRGTAQERISVPLFFNPRFDVDVAPPGSDRPVRAVDHLQRRYDETYLHLKGRG
ncbi:isopenicillin N synthase family dioxygenase [Wenxinia saemankumensis]|uniref:2-oxoglutarate-dependent ethylene/succinate-forming enzyme n=1 Tax=Wenxinia saemankumensis TaxID=1447782 RepID=A0A1M6D4B1_9RHOB|nr:2-oxoglutarate and iron-dependent oxygenase domain-containing protein [Wenxinia saemankumensis]SHI68115.1 Isopenicillin N synthase [Wenxinia saemankumensis]